jgi:hypothetical protein
MIDETPAHEFLYRAGSVGLGHLGIADASPHWYCACGGWTMAALRVPRAPTGNNERHARRVWSGHVTAACDKRPPDNGSYVRSDEKGQVTP